MSKKNRHSNGSVALQQETSELRREVTQLKEELASKEKQIEDLRVYQELEDELQKERQQLREARSAVEQEVRAQAEKIHAEYFAAKEAQLSEIENRATQLAAKTQEDARGEGARIIAEAQEVAEKLKVDAREGLEQLKSAASKELSDVHAETKRLLEQAERDKNQIIAQSKVDFEESCASRLADLDAREVSIKSEEERLKSERLKYNVERDDLKWERDELKVQSESLRSRWEQCSPERLFQAQSAASEASRLLELQEKALSDMKGEIDRLRKLVPITEGRPAAAILGDLEDAQKRLREMDERLATYPSVEEMAGLRRDSEAAKLLRVEVQHLSRRCADLDMRALQNELGRREMEQLKVEADALRVLNDELRTELQMHKDALEQKTGERFPELGRLDRTHKSRVRELQPFPNVPNLLQRVTRHIRLYAASRTTPLFYSEASIRSFLAGMASSRLEILQGLSGTGKTSLPRVFIEAIGGQCRTIPVQSSWRDRHELLGYNNDFNKRFSETEFTKAVYESGFPDQSETVWAVVLDEMNLARIEYYFADFLSVLEQPENENWAVSLMDYNPFTQTDGGPKYLVDGHRLRIPRNLWFVGTANQDESTFEITDKVYDRSQVIDFRSRQDEFAPEEQVDAFSLSLSRLEKAFKSATESQQYQLTTDEWRFVEQVDQCLSQELDLSFGNRIKLQMKRFVPVFVACGGQKAEAVDIQIARKVLRKLENRFDAGLGEALRKLHDVLRNYRPTGWNEMNLSQEIVARKIERTRGSSN